MDKQQFEALIADAVNDSELKSSEIPDIDLYVDQIISLHLEKLGKGSARFSDRQLTKTMINNYAKDRVITPVKGKKYTKEQIIQILTVYTLKNTLSIGEIKRVLDGAYAIDEFDGAALTELYDRYCSIKESNRALSSRVVAEMIAQNGLDIENDEKDLIAAIAGIVSLSAFLKNIAQAMIDERYPLPVAEEEKDKKEDKKEKKEKEKKEKKKDKEGEKGKEKNPSEDK